MFIKRSLLAVALATAAALLASGAASAASTPAQASATPFDNPTVFCTKSAPTPGARNNASPGITKDSITLTDTSVDAAQLKKLGVNLVDFHSVFGVFWNEINKCGGINGRKVIWKAALVNPLATDQVGHGQASCIKITEDQKAFIAVGFTSFSINRCVAVDHKTIYFAPSGGLARDFADSKGRLLSLYPAGDKLAAAFVKDGMARNLFKGHTVAVLGAAFPSAAAAGDQRDQYVNALKAVGVDADLQILPCVGSVCTQQLGQVVRKMKSDGVDQIVLTTLPPSTTVGPLFAEMRAQGLKAQIVGPDTDSIHGDSQMTAIVRAAGTGGAAWADQLGWYSTGVDVRGGWRIGVKETPFAKMCTGLVAKALNQRVHLLNAEDVANASWNADTLACIYARAIARAIYKAGNTVTTDTVAAILKTLPYNDRRDTGPKARDLLVYGGTDVNPQSASDMKFQFPCALPTLQNGVGCMVPVDRPARIRKI